MMIRKKGSLYIGWCWLLSLFVSLSVAAQGYDIAPKGQWVATVEPPGAEWVEKAPGSNGTAFLLVDRQWSVIDGKERFFNHLAIKAVTASGVENASTISIDFDPLYESLTLHEVSVRRDGVVTNRLDRARIDLIQREKELEYQLYDGSLTLNVILEDIRPGDTLEYSYTIEGANPIFSGHFARYLKLRWSAPIGRVHYRLLWPRARPLRLQNHETKITPIKRPGEGVTEYVWREERVAAEIGDDNTPSWYDPTPRITMSDMASWREVVDWALPLYRRTTPGESELAVIASLSRQAETKEERLLAMLEFVQEQIRYLGMEMGESSHRPSTPDEVLARRYGDCKDKARLLVSLLRGVGVEAYPALVNTVSGDYLPDALPSLREFDHVIVQVRLAGRHYWLDPTRTHQRGNLAAIYQPDYDYALVVAKSGGGLIRMSDDISAVHGKQVEETFDISRGSELPAAYRIVTEYDHYYADALRKQLAETDIATLRQSYLNYTARYFPSVEAAEAIEVEEEPDGNRLKLVEHYRIPDAWVRQPDSNYVAINFEPFLIDDQVSMMESPKRTEPYAVTHPVRYRHITRILAPEGSEFENERHEISDSAFRFVKSVEFADGELVIEYLYESLRDHVLPADIEAHAKNLRALYNLSSYQVVMIDPAIGFGEYRFDLSDVNWLMVTIAVLTLGAALLLSYRLIYLCDPPARERHSVDPSLSGLAGWLLLPGLSLLLVPVSVAWAMGDLLYVFSAVQWSVLLEGASPGLAPLIIFELVTNIVTLVVSLFLLFLFVTRRRALPKLFILFCLYLVGVYGVDLAAMALLSVSGVEVGQAEIREFIRLLVFSVIWGSYFQRSQRVKATFTRGRGGEGKSWRGDPLTENA